MAKGRSILRMSSMARESSMPQIILQSALSCLSTKGSWYVDEVRAKESEAGVEERDEYLLVSFMTKFDDNSFKWPRRPGLFSVLKTDVLFGCAAREGQAAVQPLQGLLSHQIL
jgi:hypothetical protein